MSVLGYPNFAISDASGFRRRDTATINGWIQPLDSVRDQAEGRRDLILRMPSESRPFASDVGAWSAMSGAAVFAGERLIGVLRAVRGDRDRHEFLILPIERLFERPDVRAVVANHRLALPQRSSWEKQRVGPPRRHWRDPPYPGLRPFRSDESPIFFGRDDEVDELHAMIDNGVAVVCVYGDSGSGKSSLIQAGLVPRLRSAANERGIDCTEISFTPRDEDGDLLLPPSREIERFLPHDRKRSATYIASRLAKDPMEIVPFLRDIRGVGLLTIFVDQFEELFADRHSATLGRLLAVLQAATTEPRTHLVLTLRSDHLHAATADPILGPLLRRFRLYPLGAPREFALVQMITGPATAAGLSFEPGLVQRILEDAGSEPGRLLPLIAFSLQQLYAQRGAAAALTRRFGKRGLHGIMEAVDCSFVEIAACHSGLVGDHETPVSQRR